MSHEVSKARPKPTCFSDCGKAFEFACRARHKQSCTAHVCGHCTDCTYWYNKFTVSRVYCKQGAYCTEVYLCGYEKLLLRGGDMHGMTYTVHVTRCKCWFRNKLCYRFCCRFCWKNIRRCGWCSSWTIDRRLYCVSPVRLAHGTNISMPYRYLFRSGCLCKFK